MAKAEATIEELVGMIDRGELRLPEMQRRYVWRSTRVFPKAVLKGSCTARAADDIANLAFIAGKTNRQIKDKPPSQYFPTLIEMSGRSAFEAQCIPSDPALLGIEAYKAFLASRRKAVSHRLKEFLEVNQP